MPFNHVRTIFCIQMKLHEYWCRPMHVCETGQQTFLNIQLFNIYFNNTQQMAIFRRYLISGLYATQ